MSDAVRETLRRHSASFKDESPDDDWLDEYQPQITVFCRCDWRAVDGLRTRYFKTVEEARDCWVEHFMAICVEGGFNQP